MFVVFKKHKPLLIITLLFSFIVSVVSVGAAFVLQFILDAVVHSDWALFRTMLWVVPLYIAALILVALLEGICSKKLIMRTVRDMRQKLYNGILSRDTENYQSVNSADYISALTNDVKTVEEHGIVPLLQTLQYALIFLMALVALFYYSPLIAGLMLLSLIAMYLIPAALGQPISRKQSLLSKSFAMFTVRCKDQFSGYDVIRSFLACR
jgi:ABC-type multidrug transport system fused ATPase/permease subunit